MRDSTLQSFFRTSNLKLILIVLFIYGTTRNLVATSPIPKESQQLILVITDSTEATQGKLYRFERNNAGSVWLEVGTVVPISIGRNGLAWGRGLHPFPKDKLLLKKEGDGKSPAGVFFLSAVFGKIPPGRMTALKMPYIFLKKGVECVDDPSSRYYNQLVNRDTVTQVDWQSSEKMWHPGIWYQLGVLVDHNRHPVKKGYGSCIFLHNWSHPGETTSGCTAMEPKNLKEIVFWLEAAKHPVLIQLSLEWYRQLQTDWKLPIIKEIE